MTYLQIQNDALERLNLPLDASSSARDRIKRYINEGYRWLLADVGTARALDATATITTVIDQAEYTVTASGIRTIRDTTGDCVLEQTSLVELRRRDPGVDDTGEPTAYAIRKAGATTLVVRLWPVPTDVRTLDVDIIASVTDLAADGDVPVFKAEYHSALSDYARMSEYEKMDDTRYKACAELFQAKVKALRFALRRADDRIVRQGGGPIARWSHFGSQFPEPQ